MRFPVTGDNIEISDADIDHPIIILSDEEAKGLTPIEIYKRYEAFFDKYEKKPIQNNMQKLARLKLLKQEIKNTEAENKSLDQLIFMTQLKLLIETLKIEGVGRLDHYNDEESTPRRSTDFALDQNEMRDIPKILMALDISANQLSNDIIVLNDIIGDLHELNDLIDID